MTGITPSATMRAAALHLLTDDAADVPYKAELSAWLTWMSQHVESSNNIPALRGQGMEHALACAEAILT